MSRAIVTLSAQTKKDVEQYFNCDRIPIHVVYQGYRSDIFNSNYKYQDSHVLSKYRLNRFLLCVGETRPYKNIRRLIQAFAQLKQLDLDLAIVGKPSKIDTTLTDLPQQLGIQEKVKFLGYVSDADLAVLYRSATAFIFPSLYEGFGIPPLEAMACGCPAIVSQVASLPEVCGDGAYYIDPMDIESITKGIYRVATNLELQKTLRIEGLNRAKWFQNREMFPQIQSILDEHRFVRS
ncbi:glycosyltransferase family 4 protein [Oscillatoriales cyanobacterium LEGE 11467]|uniref:Glycosyltransferase family 4 protein n=1 Tax=Zarconia navalis LEGE 11467 TaxID=1828826 RepID=A0A928VXP9_9CYAN|nr:glycosyltransferase family 4 protein [Zarconia navalis LEGE 11467]